jgi:hypothetical protein
LPALTYKIVPFTDSYKLQAYVVFSRVVNMTVNKFIETVQIKYNGKVVRSDQFSAKYFNTTTYWVTFSSITSLNENSLSIGFQPGSVLDIYGNILTVNTVE